MQHGAVRQHSRYQLRGEKGKPVSRCGHVPGRALFSAARRHSLPVVPVVPTRGAAQRCGQDRTGQDSTACCAVKTPPLHAPAACIAGRGPRTHGTICAAMGVRMSATARASSPTPAPISALALQHSVGTVLGPAQQRRSSDLHAVGVDARQAGRERGGELLWYGSRHSGSVANSRS